MQKNRCQLQGMEEISQEVGRLNLAWQRVKKVKHAVKRRLNFATHTIKHRWKKHQILHETGESQPGAADLKPGDWVRVRSRPEIEATLDGWNKLKGCAFMQEMWPYCGTEQRVFKQVNQFMDERDYLIKKARGIYLLDGVFCDGAHDFGPCDRSCFFFWRREWLQKIEKA